MNRGCAAEDCGRDALFRGMCRAHYERWRRARPGVREAEAEYDQRRRGTPEYREYERARYRLRAYKKAANNALGRAIRSGEVVREPCEVCGDPESQGHHKDYDAALQVVWLCSTHHAERHWRVGTVVA